MTGKKVTIKMLRTQMACDDDDLNKPLHFKKGKTYDVGPELAQVMLDERWGKKHKRPQPKPEPEPDEDGDDGPKSEGKPPENKDLGHSPENKSA